MAGSERTTVVAGGVTVICVADAVTISSTVVVTGEGPALEGLIPLTWTTEYVGVLSLRCLLSWRISCSKLRFGARSS